MSNDTQIQAHMALVDEYAMTYNTAVYTSEKERAAARAAVEAALRDAPTAVEPPVIDKAELKRLVSLVFGDEFQIVRATPSAPTAVEPQYPPGSAGLADYGMTHDHWPENEGQAEPDERAEFEAWCALDNPKYHPSDDGISNRRDWKVWQAARASKGTK